jgi:hypothetical protein
LAASGEQGYQGQKVQIRSEGNFSGFSPCYEVAEGFQDYLLLLFSLPFFLFAASSFNRFLSCPTPQQPCESNSQEAT